MDLYREMTEASGRTGDAPFVGPDETAKFWVCRKYDAHREVPTESRRCETSGVAATIR
jgi:hypothetical protein